MLTLASVQERTWPVHTTSGVLVPNLAFSRRRGVASCRPLERLGGQIKNSCCLYFFSRFVDPGYFYGSEWRPR